MSTHEQPLQFIDTTKDYKEYYYLYETIGEHVYLQYFTPNEHGIYHTNHTIKETYKVNFNYIEFLDKYVINHGRGQAQIFYSLEYKFNLKYNKYKFVEIFNEASLPRVELNKYVGLLAYAGEKGEESFNVSFFSKLPESTILYKPMVVTSDIISDIQNSGHKLTIYYYGEKIPDTIPHEIRQLMAPMPLSVFVVNRDKCSDHDTFHKECVHCVMKNLLIAPRQTTTRFIRRKIVKRNGRNRRYSKY